MSRFQAYITLLFLQSNLFLFSQSLPKPVFSAQAGYYSDSVVLQMSTSVSGSQIRYTTNGQEPTINSTLYTNPVHIKNRSHSANSISTIPTNPSFNYPKPGYDTSRADSRGWLPPFDTVFKATVVKAKVFKSGWSSDSTSTATYLIKEGSTAMFNLPVLSISLDSSALFDYYNGIYVYGADSLNEGNYMRDTAVRKAYTEFFETTGTIAFSQYANIKIHGNGGRHAPQKSLQIKAEKEFGKSTFDYSFFPGSPLTKYDRFLLRNSGHRPDCMGRDDIGQELLKSLSNVSQNNRYCVVLFNGEYWGVQTIKEILDNNYFYRRYNIPKSACVILTQAGSLSEGLPGDEDFYTNLLDFFANNDLSINANYDYVNSQMDIESFTDFQCAEIFLGNGDWPNNNTKFWRYRTAQTNPSQNNHLDGRLRWLFYDLDATFGGDCSGIYPSHNSLTRATDPVYNKYTRPLRTLLTNTEYKVYFINRFADLLNTSFLPSQLIDAISKTTNTINSEMMEHVERWRYPSVAATLQARALETPSLSKWSSITSGMTNFASTRGEKTRRHFMNYFLLQDTVKITLNVNDTLKGKIKINSLYLDQNLIRNQGNVYPWTGVYFNGNPITVEAIAYPGYKFSHWNTVLDTLNSFTKNVTADTLVTAYFVNDTSFKPQHYLYINEILASNKSNITDEYFENDDWIELYNPNNFSVDVAGFYLSDDVFNKTKYRIKASSKQTIVPAHGFKLVWADKETFEGDLHANFKLSSLGDSLFLIMPNGQQVTDSVFFQNQQADKSFGREHDADKNWIIFDVPTPNASNRIIETPEPDYFIVFPNPTTDVLYFTQTLNVSVFNLLGQNIGAYEKIKKLDVSALPIGMYIIKTEYGQSVKFIKR